MKAKIRPVLLVGIGIAIVLMLLINYFISDPLRVEAWYSLGFYPLLSFIPKGLFGWTKISVGDMLYCFIVIGLIYLFVKILIDLFYKRYINSLNGVLIFISSLLFLYISFHVLWGINYYRVPVAKQLKLTVDTVLMEDHLKVLDKHINIVNTLRDQLDVTALDKEASMVKLQEIMERDRDFLMLSKTQVKIKQPLFLPAASYFGVSGYFNPFTHEAQVNSAIPVAGYPFTVVHELTHQMGIGFEDESNFIAFIKLKDNPSVWFRYSAYYQSVQYLLRSLYLVDKEKFEEYKLKLSQAVKNDLRTEQLFWAGYTGWITDITGLFYDQYLKHNNQLEGMARYGMVSRLIIAYEKKGLGSPKE